MYTLPVKIFGHPEKFLFLILKVLLVMKQVKHYSGFIYYIIIQFFFITLWGLRPVNEILLTRG